MILQVVDKQQTGRNVFFLFGKPMQKHGKRTTTWRSAFGCKTMGFLRSIPPTSGFQSPPRTIPFLGTGIPINKPFILPLEFLGEKGIDPRDSHHNMLQVLPCQLGLHPPQWMWKIKNFEFRFRGVGAWKMGPENLDPWLLQGLPHTCHLVLITRSTLVRDHGYESLTSVGMILQVLTFRISCAHLVIKMPQFDFSAGGIYHSK